MSSSGEKKKPSFLKRLLKVLLIILLVIVLLAVAAYIAFRIFIKPPKVDPQVVITPAPVVTQPVNGEDPDPSQTQAPEPTPIVLTRKQGVFTCLLIGSDWGNGRADTIIVAVFDTNAKTASLLSIPRDTLVHVNGYNRKINSVYASGGAELLRDTVENMLGIPIDYYIRVQLEGFSAIVDKIGGVWFDVPVEVANSGETGLSAGYQLLNGKQALLVVRNRHGYAGQDFGRVQTQRAFLVALAKQTITFSNVTKVSSLIKIVNTYVTTDMPLDTMIYFATQAIGMNLDSSLYSVTLPGRWISPYVYTDAAQALEIVNNLGIYETEVPMGALNIRR